MRRILMNPHDEAHLMDGVDEEDPAPSEDPNFDPSEHSAECYARTYPNDPGAHCTCMDWSPEV